MPQVVFQSSVRSCLYRAVSSMFVPCGRIPSMCHFICICGSPRTLRRLCSCSPPPFAPVARVCLGLGSSVPAFGCSDIRLAIGRCTPECFRHGLAPFVPDFLPLQCCLFFILFISGYLGPPSFGFHTTIAAASFALVCHRDDHYRFSS